MIRIEVTAYNGQPPRGAVAADFDEMGGNIGRAEGNALVLPDPERLISRLHASVVFREGSYLIRDHSSGTPVFVNGNPLGNGREVVLHAGDEIRIGGYMMRTSFELLSGSAGALAVSSRTPGLSRVESSLPADNPFADLISPAATPPAQSPNPPAGAPAVRKNRVVDDLSTTPRSDKAESPIPDDFDPFAEPTPSPAAPQLPDDFDAGLGGFTAKRSIDELFDLRASEAAGSFAGNPPSESLPNASLGAIPLDPMEAIGAVRPGNKPFVYTQRDDVPEIHANFRVPASRGDPALLQRPGDGTPQDVMPGLGIAAPEHGRGANFLDVRSSDREVPTTAHPPADVSGRARSVPSTDAMTASASRMESSVTSEPNTDPRTDDKPLHALDASGRGAAGAATSAATERHAQVDRPSPSPAAADQLLREFLAGAGVPNLEMSTGLTPRLMNMLGQLLRESTQGTLDLLRARALLKHEMRANMTMIAERENNPLKFSPDVQAAMMHLLAPQGRGYMTPLRAMKDAYNDLRAHEFGFMAGMRAALAGVLARFSPEQLERRIPEGTALDKILPMNRKAKRWNSFIALYEDLSKEAEDDFHTLFGKEFLRAYAAQIAKFEEEDKDAHDKSGVA